MGKVGSATHLLIVLILVLYIANEIEAKGGRGGGGRGRGGGSRGSGSSGKTYGRGWSKTGSSWTGSGRPTFGSPKRWSYNGGRRYYYVGYYGHRHHYGGSRGGYEDEGEPLGPWMVMLIVLAGINGTGFVCWLGTYCYYKNKRE